MSKRRAPGSSGGMGRNVRRRRGGGQGRVGEQALGQNFDSLRVKVAMQRRERREQLQQQQRRQLELRLLSVRSTHCDTRIGVNDNTLVTLTSSESVSVMRQPAAEVAAQVQSRARARDGTSRAISARS